VLSKKDRTLALSRPLQTGLNSIAQGLPEACFKGDGGGPASILTGGPAFLWRAASEGRSRGVHKGAADRVNEAKRYEEQLQAGDCAQSQLYNLLKICNSSVCH